MPHLLLVSELQLLHEPLLALLLLGRRLQPRLQRLAVDAGKSCEQLMPVQQQQARQQPTEPADAGAPAMPSVADAKCLQGQKRQQTRAEHARIDRG